MFQMMVVDLIISDVTSTLKEIEETNCKLPQRLEKLQGQWRQQKASVDSWKSYYGCIGTPMPAFPSAAAWIADCQKRAASKGPKYGGAKGDGKGYRGNGDGKGKGKGGGNRG